MPYTSDLAALLIHTHHELHLEDIPFWVELVQEHGAPVLELGCGTGRVLTRLVGEGYHTVGLDFDLGMLNRLRMEWPAHLTTKPKVFQADFSSFNLGLSFGVICLPCNTLTVLPASRRYALFRRVHHHLKPGGCFAFSLPNPGLINSLPTRGEPEMEELFSHPIDQEPVQVSSSWVKEASRITLSWHYDHLQPDGTVTRTTISTTHEFVSHEELILELAASGLSITASYGDFDLSPFTNDSPHLILVTTHSKPYVPQ